MKERTRSCLHRLREARPPASPGALVSGSGVLSGAPGPQHACRNHQAREAAVSYLKLFSCGNREAHFKAARGDPDRLAGGSPRGHTPPDGGSPPSCLPLVKTEYGGNATPGPEARVGGRAPRPPTASDSWQAGVGVLLIQRALEARALTGPRAGAPVPRHPCSLPPWPSSSPGLCTLDP